MAQLRKFNYQFAKPDPRDKSYHHHMRAHRALKLPDEVDLTTLAHYPAIRDQGDIGSCTAEAACAVKSFITRKYVPHQDYPSVLGFYYCERDLNGTTESDAGSDGRTSALVMLKTGVGSERLWSYTHAHLLRKPAPSYYFDAVENKIGAFYVCTSHEQIKHSLAQGGPVVFGSTCLKEWVDDNFDGWTKSYKVDDVLVEDGEVAGHQMSIFGYKYFDGKLFYLVRQSWGDWGLKDKPGHMWLTADMLMDPSWTDMVITYRLAREIGI